MSDALCICGHFVDEHHDGACGHGEDCAVCDACDCDRFEPRDDDDEGAP